VVLEDLHAPLAGRREIGIDGVAERADLEVGKREVV